MVKIHQPQIFLNTGDCLESNVEQILFICIDINIDNEWLFYFSMIRKLALKASRVQTLSLNILNADAVMSVGTQRFQIVLMY